MNSKLPIRVCIQQPTLAAYRVPLYRELARDERISLKIVHAQSPDLPNCDADGFETEEFDEWNIPLVRRKLLWHRPQVSLAVRDRCDVLVFSSNLRYVSLLPGLLRARRNGVATVLWGHHYGKSGSLISESARKRLFFRMADSVLCYSHDVADSIRKSPALAEKTFVAPNALDQAPIVEARNHWMSHPALLEAFRIEHDIGAGPQLLFVSRIKERNKLEVLLKTLSIIRQKYPSATATIVGAHNDEQRRIQAIGTERGLGNAIRFPGAIYNERELAPWFLTADVFLYPSQIGLSLFHSFGYGLPVVAGLHAKLRNPEVEALREGANGFRFDDGDAEQAAERVLRILDSPGLKIQLSRSAIETVRDEFNIAIMAQGFLDAVLFAAKKRGIEA